MSIKRQTNPSEGFGTFYLLMLYTKAWTYFTFHEVLYDFQCWFNKLVMCNLISALNNSIYVTVCSLKGTKLQRTKRWCDMISIPGQVHIRVWEQVQCWTRHLIIVLDWDQQWTIHWCSSTARVCSTSVYFLYTDTSAQDTSCKVGCLGSLHDY